MQNFAIISDSSCDLSPELQEQYGIRVLPGHLVLPDKREILSMPQWDWCTREEFYRDLKKNPNSYFTSPANVGEVAQVMEEYAAQGVPVLMIALSSGISGAYNFSLQAKAQVEEKYPQSEIACVDSLRFGPALGLMLVHAAQCRDRGMSLAETVDYLEQNKNRFHQAGWHEDLAFVAKKGRITHAKAFFGTLAGVKPIGEFDYNGLTTVIGKVKGAKATCQVLLSYMEQTGEDLENQTVFVAHSNRPAQAEEYKKLIEERFHPKAIYVHDIYFACGVNAGPGLVAAYYVGKPISQGLTVEQQIVEQCISRGE